MPKNMSICVNGQDQVPPGFRFHPTEEELLHYYLRKKVSYEKIDLDVIRDVDLNKLEPWDIQEKCKIGTAHQNDWYFFSHKDKKYPTGTRTNRATAAGFWKATGRDKVIRSNGKRIGMRKTLVFYRGRAPQGQKSDWIMHEYRLDDTTNGDDTNVLNDMGYITQEEGWVVCRIFKKKHFHKTLDIPIISSITTTEEITRTQMPNSNDEGSLEQMVNSYMEKTCKEENEEANINSKRYLKQIDTTTTAANYNNNGLRERFMKLPSLYSPNSTSSSQPCYRSIGHAHAQIFFTDNEAPTALFTNPVGGNDHPDSGYDQLEIQTGINDDWATFDRLEASHHLNGQTETSKKLSSSCFINNEPSTAFSSFSLTDDHDHLQLPELRRSSFSSTSISNRQPYPNTSLDYHSQNDSWGFITRSFSDPKDHVSNAHVQGRI